ncbi:putative dual-specificity RNA methyltransferase RlmN [Nitrospira tepida]|uniref:Probable dual-specificity RNA methyltransferase RlmN n=2 Tax=Nitrospira tepida TaxID=2973512 RepID=A0AA86N2S3_9BACT|nr:putative dual-specificity RNA methyltransferase RlmN [Nitrospira tepida]
MKERMVESAETRSQTRAQARPVRLVSQKSAMVAWPMSPSRSHTLPLLHLDSAPPNLLALDPDSLETLIKEWGWPGFRARQILRWLYARRARSIDQMTDLSLRDRSTLRERTMLLRLPPPTVRQAADGTKKFLFQLDDGLIVESVLIPDGRRLTLCLSSQVGCTFDCRFCLTGTMGLKRNLKPHEIVGQMLSVQDTLAPEERISNLVFMGMGEPLANLDALRESIQRLTNDDWGVGLSARRITVSTAGLASKIPEVAGLGIRLAVSLNATTDSLRAAIMPAVDRLYPLATLLDACRRFPLSARARLTFEYVLLAGVNDSRADAARLVTLLRGFRCKVNLIPFNEFPQSPFRRPSDKSVLAFQSILRASQINALIRKSKGPDVLGACGQLGVGPEPHSVALTPLARDC